MTMVAEPPAPAVAPERLTIREYFSAQSDLYTKTDAKRIGPELARLAADGKTKLKDVVDAARPKTAPLHCYFTWDDQLAAERFRQMEAGRMVRAIKVYTVSGGQERSEPAFQPITVKVVASQQPSPAARTASAPASNGAASIVPPAPSSPPAQETAASVDEDDLVAAAQGGPRDATDAETELIERALMALEDWERRYQRKRSQPGFEAVFRPVFVAIAEARERSDGRI